jgi:hypothetical protein
VLAGLALSSWPRSLAGSRLVWHWHQLCKGMGYGCLVAGALLLPAACPCSRCQRMPAHGASSQEGGTFLIGPVARRDAQRTASLAAHWLKWPAPTKPAWVPQYIYRDTATLELQPYVLPKVRGNSRELQPNTPRIRPWYGRSYGEAARAGPRGRAAGPGDPPSPLICGGAECGWYRGCRGPLRARYCVHPRTEPF